MPRTRTFIGVEIGDEIRASAVALQEALAKTGAEVKWVEPENLHISLLFLGEVDDRELHSVCRIVKAAATAEAPFPLRVLGVGAFPTPRRPKILWAGITEGAEPLKRLYDALEGPLADLGYRKEERGYTPHLTLGRVKAEADGFTLAKELPKHFAWDGGRTVVEEILVFSSVLEKAGPVYTILGRAEMAGA